MPSARPYHHGNLKQALIDAAVALVAEVGPQGFTLREVARRAGLPLVIAGNVPSEHRSWFKSEIEPHIDGSKVSYVGAVDDAQKVIDDLHRKIGQLQVERDFLAGQPAISRLLRGGR